jgi:hypothetical protein
MSLPVSPRQFQRMAAQRVYVRMSLQTNLFAQGHLRRFDDVRLTDGV